MIRALAIGLLIAATTALTVAWRAPAAWLGDWVEARSKLRLLDARGTVWQGSALLGFSDGRETTVVPGRVEWRVNAVSPVQVSVSHPWLTAPLALSLGTQVIGFTKGTARVPAGVLTSTGAPFNTIRPGGVLELAWSEGQIRGPALTGELQVDWRDAQSALSTVVPLGSYRLRISGSGQAPAIELRTLAGPLQMEGTGTMAGSRIRFNGVAAADPAMRPALNGLLGVMGMRSGDKVLLAIDT
jgi:general secretion pathway protein N